MQTANKPKIGNYFRAARKRDDKIFMGRVENVRSMGIKGIMVVISSQADHPFDGVLALPDKKYSTVYLDECVDYDWSEFPLD